MRMLVTGGCGFIGSNFIHYYIKRHPDVEIVNLDKLTYAGRLENLQDIADNKNYTFIKGDVCNANDVKKAMQGVSLVVHFAAESHVDRSIEDPLSFLRTDTIGTAVLLEEARRQDIEKFVCISTDEVYGSVEEGFAKEDWQLKPSSPYSASKAAADRLAYAYYYTYGLPVVIHRGSNNFGPYQYPEKIIPLFITNLLRGKKVPLYGTGLNKRDWLYVEDNCASIELLLEKGKKGEAYNVAAHNELTNLELTKMILKELGLTEKMIEFVKDRPGHDKRYALNTEKIEALGWKPKWKFEDALRYTINWYEENEWWWKPLVK
ncbi:MAG: dTDP-glucose 4,6-dehydratase [Candidatus Iainarchaeum archaeon]|uniref:dTDP-glucose 4,6-dehydratase n=1 Tax=Candidatus Iainarchaeum sp. TaxID=3101447 RepID=A0A497JGM2_9ARCH|nr:MAG: dTDP-glucose 4,6-dehydratase [Candidatus Diapherotrites archaeon]